MNLNPTMTRARFDTALALAMNGELVSDTGAWDALDELFQQIAAEPSPAERAVLIAKARHEYQKGAPA